MVAEVRVRLVVCALALLAAGSGALHAQRFPATTTAQAASAAGAVVAAKVVDVSVRSEGWIYTYVTFETTDHLKGSAPTRFVTRMMGGRVGNTQTAAAIPLPQFTPGEEVVVFLTSQASPDGNVIVMQDHVYRVSNDAGGARTIVPAPTGFSSSLRPAAVAGAAGQPAAAGARYADFRTALKSLK